MNIRKQINQVEDSIDFIWSLNPKAIDLKDLRVLMQIFKNRANDDLGHLGWEIQHWIAENKDILRKRLLKVSNET